MNSTIGEVAVPALNDKTKEPEILAALDELVLDWPEVTTGKMFGSRSYRAKGVLFAMIGGKGLILTKLRPEQRQVAVEKHDAHAFVGRGKEVPAWTEFALDEAAGLQSIAAMVRDAYENALTEIQ